MASAGADFQPAHLDRIVPGADADADAERLAPRIGEGAAEIDVVAIVARDRAAEIFERVGGRGGVGDQRLLDRLAGVERLEPRQLGVARAQDVGGAAQDAAALDRLQPRPGRLRCARCFDGEFDDVLASPSAAWRSSRRSPDR